MAEAIKSAIPSHLRPGNKDEGNSSENNGFEKRHHGKTRSHMVRCLALYLFFSFCFDATRLVFLRLLHALMQSSKAPP